MNSTLNLGAPSNQQKILLLQQKLKNIDALNPKVNSNTSFIRMTPNQQSSFQSKPRNNPSPAHNQNLLPLQLKYIEVQDKMNQRAEQEQRLLSNLEYEIQSLQQQSRMLKKQVERSKEDSEDKLNNVEKDLSQNIQQQMEEIRGIKKQIVQSIQKKYRTIKSQTMAILGSQFQNELEESRGQIVRNMEDLRHKMENQQGSRDQVVQYMVTSFGGQILKLQQLVHKQKEQRSESHKKLLSMVFSMQQQITTKILGQKRDCSSSLANLQGYLQQLCFKIENHLLR